jgi:hypothetical protein
LLGTVLFEGSDLERAEAVLWKDARLPRWRTHLRWRDHDL